MEKRTLLLIAIHMALASMVSRAATDPVWQAYHDSMYAYLNTGQFHEGIRCLEQGKLRLEEQLEDYAYDSAYNLTLNDLGGLYYYLGKYDESIALMEISLRNAGAGLGTGNPMYAVFLNNLAVVYKGTGRYTEALPIYLEALELQAGHVGKQHRDYGLTLVNIASIYKAMGRYSEALELYEQALENAVSNYGKESYEYAIRLNNYADLLQTLERFDEALPLHIEALAVIERTKTREHPDYTTVANNLASLYKKTGEYDRAETLYKESIALSREKYGSDHWVLGTQLNNLAQLYNTMGRYEEALPLYQEALRITEVHLGKQHRRYAQRLNNLADLYRNTGELEMALPLIAEASANTRYQIGKVFTISGEADKGDFLASIKVDFEKYLSLAYDLDFSNIRLNGMLYNNELLLKGLVLSSTRDRMTRILTSGDEDLMVLFREWKYLRDDLARQYSLPVARRSADLDSLEKHAGELERQLVLASSEFASLQQDISWRDVKQELEPGEAAIEFVRFRYHSNRATDSVLYAAMILTGSALRPRIVPLFLESDLLEHIETQPGENELERMNRIYGARGHDALLYRMIWSGLEGHMENVDRVYFAPAGLLHQVSLDALPQPGGRLLGSGMEFVRVNSTRQLAAERRSPLPGQALLYGGIDYEYIAEGMEDSSRSRALHAEVLPTGERSHLADRFEFLPGTYKEVSSIGDLFRRKKLPVDVRTGTAATEKDFKALSGNAPRVLHLATHGFFFPDRELTAEQIEHGASFRFVDDPMFRAGLVLSGANYAWEHGFNPFKEEDGILTAYEIADLDLSGTELVVLSACETGLGELRGSEGVYGLQRAFKMAGVDNLVMSLWKVPDANTMELMESFYSHWLKGYDVRTAFRRAQAEMSERYDPFFWAAFVLVGDVVEAKVPRRTLPWWAYAVGIFIAVMLIAVVYSSTRSAA